MSQGYLTIDPLIMETLNLNQKRIHRIFDILHGKNPDEVPMRNVVTHRHRLSSPVRQYETSQKSIIEQHNHNLPLIRVTKGRNSLLSKYEMPALKQNNKGMRSRGSSLTVKKNLLDQTEQMIEQTSKRNKLQYKFSREIQRVLSPKNERKELHVDFAQQKRVRKNEQVIKDYTMNIQRSKSAEINTKDVYRLQIQSFVAELTPIDQLEECEKKMKRLKKRHNHLKIFDRRYFSKLNQQEFNQLI